MNDEVARQAIVADLDDTLVVEAAAGTGKTTELVRRIIAVLSSGRATMTAVVAVTFTEKAAGELKLRLRETLEVERAKAGEGAVRERLEAALETLEEAHVNTIHGFCTELLRERPVEARVDPLFAVMTEAQANRLYDRAFREWLQDVLESPPEGVRRALRRTSAPSFMTDGDSDGPIDRLRGAGRALAEWRDFERPWQRPPFDRDAEIERVLGFLHHLADVTSAPGSERDNLFLDTDGVRRRSRQIRLEASFGDRDLDGWESGLVDLVRDRGLSRTRKGSGQKFGKDVARVDVLAARDTLFFELQEFKRRADADLAACLQAELAGATARYQALKTAAGLLDFADLLAKARDLIRGNRSVRGHLQRKFARIFIDEFQDTDPIQAEILMLLAADNPDEADWEAVRPLPGKLFIVGDPKQAIYRFRGTDVGTYQRVSRHVERQGGRVLQLTTSYRSLPQIQHFVNAAFSLEMVRDEFALQAAYVPLSPYRERLEGPGAPEGPASQPAIIALPVPTPYSTRGPLKASARAIDSSLPDVTGALIAWLVDPKHGWQVSEPRAAGPGATERDGDLVPLQPRHIAILFRRFVSFGQDITRAYTDAIEARGIPHLLVGGKSFHGREEVETLRAALAAIEWPDDELSVFAALKGALFAIDDEQLIEFKHRFGAFHPFRIPKALGGNSGGDLELTGEPTAHLMPIAVSLRLLQQLHRGRNYRPVADTIGRLLAETRAHVGFILRPAGEQALANVLHIAELARQYEAGGGISFRGFIDELRSASDAEGAEAPILEESSDGVRLMTVHKAKGLEFPVVILADLTCRMSRGDASRYLDVGERLCAMKIAGWAPHDLHEHEHEEVARDEAEGVRLAYVAATRARDLLVVPALGDEPWEGGWFSPLNRALYPPLESRRTPTRGARCPSFKSKDSVLRRPNEETAGLATVCPGEHVFAGAGYSVVWWEPGPGGGLELGVTPPFGVRQEELIVKDVAKDVVADGRSAYDRWRLGRADALAAGAKPSIVATTVHALTAEGTGQERLRPERGAKTPSESEREPSAMSGGGGAPTQEETWGPASSEEDVSIVNISGGESDRPGGAAFGTLIHAVLAEAPFDATREVLEGVASVESRMLGLTDGDAAAAAASVERVLGHELLSRARAAAAKGRCRRETPITLTLPDGTLVEGVVDLAFEDDGGWTVVDYKTDREIRSAGEARYRRQVALYAAAIAQATNARATAVLVRI